MEREDGPLPGTPDEATLAEVLVSAGVCRGDPTIFFTHPLSAATLVLALIILVVATLPKARAKRDEVFVE